MHTIATLTPTLLAWHDGPGRHHDGGPWFLIPLVFWLLAATAIVLIPRRRSRWHRTGGLVVLSERYARGEIDEAEYRARRAVLTEKQPRR